MSAITNKVSEWLTKVKSSILIYKNGFYEIPLIIYSPEMVVESAGSLFFSNHNKKHQFITGNNPFVKYELNYYKIEEGLWIIYTEVFYKKNIRFVPHHNAKEKDANHYYTLSLNLSSHCKTLQVADTEESFYIHNMCWFFLKPKRKVETLNFKNTESKYITLHFNEKWLEENINNDRFYNSKELKSFLESDKTFFMWPQSNEKYKDESIKLKNEFLGFRNNSRMNYLRLKTSMYQLIQDFVEIFDAENINFNEVEIKDNQRNLIQRIENHLQENLTTKFEGIKVLSDKFNVSETKLKNDFKQIYGKPIYQYFNEQQMLFAKELLLKKKQSIKELANSFGYESPGKFSEAFKKYIGCSPSDL